ncbi:MAG: sulfatase [Planctomycetes bacterium]|nr:sulfatase [Planctomycetota bacterium]
MPEKPPNLLLVFADQLRSQALGCYGNIDCHTPALDTLAAQGTRFTRCFANTPVCSPNRATLFSGTYPLRNRMICNDMPFFTGIPYLGNVCRAAGYRTGYVGKWHLDGIPRSKFTPPGQRRAGFDYWRAFNCNHNYYATKYYADGPEYIEEKGYSPEIHTRLAREFLRAQNDTRDPFCLVVSWGPPHDPYHMVPKGDDHLYRPDKIHLRPNVQEDTSNPLACNLNCRQTHADYYYAVTALDDQVMVLLDTLDEIHRSDDTIVVFTSDHGDMLWSHGYMKKQAPFEESISIPCIMRWPGGLPSFNTFDGLTSTVDMFPTMLSLMNLPVPDSVEGMDISAALRGEPDAPVPDAVLIANHISCDEANRQGMPEWRGIRTSRYTYAELVGGRPWLLFDNESDPYQMNNLVENPDHITLRRQMTTRLYEMLSNTGDPFLNGHNMAEHTGLARDFERRNDSALRDAPAL